VATALTLLVIAAAGRRAPRATVADRAWLRGSLGLLCALTLVVVASALHRMALYQEAYGFTRLRLLVSVFEGWLGVVVLLVMAAGVLRARGWLVPAAVRLGAVGLLGLAVFNPDLYIAQHNLARDTSTIGIDWQYLGDLSTDAYPAIWELGDTEFNCVTRFREATSTDDWLEWNLSRDRASDLVASRPPAGRSGATTVACPGTGG
jgi:hypothetical protein